MFFSEVFDAMFRLCADSETNVQNAVQFLDNLVKVGGSARTVSTVACMSLDTSTNAYIARVQEIRSKELVQQLGFQTPNWSDSAADQHSRQLCFLLSW